jgi:hypothetical protein
VTDGGGSNSSNGSNSSAADISARQAGSQDTSGRGLQIVAELCDTWGVTAKAGATTVWARSTMPA